MKSIFNTFAKASLVAAMSLMAVPSVVAQEKADWGDFKLFIDPGHSGRENRGIWGYSEAEKVLAVALNIKDMLETYTTIADGETLRLCRYDENTVVSLEERSDMANAWGADFYYSIHSDASGSKNEIVLLFGGWRKDGVEIEKTPNGGKAYGEFLEPNLSGVMRIGSRGNWYDRCFYDRAPQTHTNQYPYLSVNRRSNMPSLLSEGGYHDMAEQQQRNMNKDYKRLEAFAAFQAILQYRGMALPAQTFLTGVISNSENGQPINGARITVDGKTYTTDTYEELFSKYTKNENLIHNGFYIFEGLEAGKEYDVAIEADGFESVTEKVIIKSGGATSPDYVTFLDKALTNMMPAKVDAVSVEDIENVSPRDPLGIVFSRNMDRASVEQAFSIDNNAQVSLSWANDYTLVVDVSALEPYTTYTITIDGSVARNSQTNLNLDGDGDGQPGGNYVLAFTMAEPDTEAPYVVATYPADGSEALFTDCPPIRIEFNEEIAFNGDKHDGCVTVKDSKGKTYTGLTTHDVVRGRSVIHFYASEPYTPDAAVLVSFAGGIADLSDNVAEPYHFRFLTEYRAKSESTMMCDCQVVNDFFPPGGSGSSSGVNTDESNCTAVNVGPSINNRTSLSMNYLFDEDASTNNFFIREYYRKSEQKYISDFDGMLHVWIYGDGSNNGASIGFRIAEGVKYAVPTMPVDFIGWNLLTVDMSNTQLGCVSGTATDFSKATRWCFDHFTLTHARITEDDEDEDGNPLPYQEWSGSIYYNNLEYTKWDDQAERTAKIEDIDLPDSGVANIALDSNAPAEYYNLQGIRVANPSAGIYIVRQGNRTAKVTVK